ncbi:MAG: hypothetical protein FJX29_15005 [Alphaproteobacteria bacterium]|nr:hypothetical protein [Alphaproteobacteria bacterium]
MSWLAPIAVIWGVATLYLFLQVIGLCYRIEKRSYPEAFATDTPRRANILGVIFNYKIARDRDTQAMRKQMNFYLAIILAGFVAMGLLVSIWARAQAG